MILLADRLRGLRGTESQTAFAARFGLKQAIYSHYETGRKKPSLEVLVQMAQTLGATTDYLLGLSDEPPKNTSSGIKAGDINGSFNIVGDGNSVNVKVPPPSSSLSTAKKKAKRENRHVL